MAGADPPSAPRSFPQRAGSSPKQNLLFELARGRTAVRAAIAGLTAASGNEPMAPGKWSVRETLLHLVTRDQARLDEMDAALGGAVASWEGARDADWARINAANLAPIHHLSWDETLRLLDETRRRLIDALERVPEDGPVWNETHAFGLMFLGFQDHDRHHADIIKEWRTRRG